MDKPKKIQKWLYYDAFLNGLIRCKVLQYKNIFGKEGITIQILEKVGAYRKNEVIDYVSADDIVVKCGSRGYHLLVRTAVDKYGVRL